MLGDPELTGWVLSDQRLTRLVLGDPGLTGHALGMLLGLCGPSQASIPSQHPKKQAMGEL